MTPSASVQLQNLHPFTKFPTHAAGHSDREVSSGWVTLGDPRSLKQMGFASQSKCPPALQRGFPS